MVAKLKVVVVSLICILVLVGLGYYFYFDYQEAKAEDYKEALRELDRINRKLGVNPDNLADPLTRRVSKQARDFVIMEEKKAGEND